MKLTKLIQTAALSLSVASCGDNPNEEIEYTCQTGAQMVLDLCCPLEEIKCGGVNEWGERNKTKQEIYDFIVEDCSEVRSSEYQNPLQYFPCVEDVCKNQLEPVEDNLRECENSYLD